jgi:hypothetical protein
MIDGEKAYSCLVVGLLNGNIVVWRLNAVPARREKSDLQPQILLQFETKMHNITALHWREIDRETGTSNLYSYLLSLLVYHAMQIVQKVKTILWQKKKNKMKTIYITLLLQTINHFSAQSSGNFRHLSYHVTSFCMHTW